MLSWSSIEAFISPIMFLKSKSSCSFFFFHECDVFPYLSEIFNVFFFSQVFSLLHNLLLQCFFPGLFIWLSFMLAAFLRCLMMLGCSCLTKILVRSSESWAGCWRQTSEPGGSAGQFVLQHRASGSLGISFGTGCPVDLLSGVKEGGLSRVVSRL